MATNEVLQVVDEIIDGQPKYNITNNSDGTKGIELANDVIAQGTPLNKSLFQRVNNVLSYLTPSVEKVQTIIHDVPFVNPNNVACYSCDTTFGLAQSVSEIDFTYDEFNEALEQPKFKIKGSNDIYFHNPDTLSAQHPIVARVYWGNGSYYVPNYFRAIFARTSSSPDYQLELYVKGNTSIDFVYDLRKEFSFDYHYFIWCDTSKGTTTKLYKSNNGTNWEEIGNASMSTDTSIRIENTRYLKISLDNTSASDSSFHLRNSFFANISGTADKTLTTSENTLDNNITFKNNQRLLIETPSAIDLTNVEASTLNGILVDKILQPSTKYELKYNESLNKFELDGMMNKLTLLDITLTENVGVIETDLFSKMKSGKLYVAIIIGKLTTSENIWFGDSNGHSCNIGYLTNSNNITKSLWVFDDTNKILSTMTDYSSNNIIRSVDTLSKQEIYVGSNTAFTAGTRIIIKEVA